MKTLLIDLGNGREVAFEDEAKASASERLSQIGDSSVKTLKKTLPDAIKDAEEAVALVLARFRERLDPSSLEVEIGLKLGGECSAVIAKTQAEAHFKIKATWKK